MSRETGVVDAVAALQRGDHVCWTYSSEAEHAGVLVAFFQQGLSAGERLFYFGYGGSADRVLVALRDAGLQPDELIRLGRLVMGDAVQAYLPDGRFDAQARIEGFRAVAREAIAAGYEGVRVAAENGGVLDHPEVGDQWYPYEVMVELLTGPESIVGLCCFDRNRCDADTLELLDAVHRRNLDPDGSAPRNQFHVNGKADGTLKLSGEVDAFGAPRLRKLIDAPELCLEARLIDVSELEFIDAAGIRALEGVALDRASDGTPLKLHGATAQLRRLWSLVSDPAAPIALAP